MGRLAWPLPRPVGAYEWARRRQRLRNHPPGLQLGVQQGAVVQEAGQPGRHCRQRLYHLQLCCCGRAWLQERAGYGAGQSAGLHAAVATKGSMRCTDSGRLEAAFCLPQSPSCPCFFSPARASPRPSCRPLRLQRRASPLCGSRPPATRSAHRWAHAPHPLPAMPQAGPALSGRCCARLACCVRRQTLLPAGPPVSMSATAGGQRRDAGSLLSPTGPVQPWLQACPDVCLAA